MLWQFQTGGVGPSAFGIHMFIYALLFSYKLTVSNGLSLTTFNSAEITLCSGSFKWGGPSAFGIHLFIYALVFSSKLTVSNGLSLATLNSEEITLCSGSFKQGGRVHLPLVSICLYMHCYFLIFSYKLTVSNGISLTTLNSAEITLCSGSFEGGGGPSAFGIHLSCHIALVFSYMGSSKLTVSNGLSLTTLKSEEITLCSGSFKWGEDITCHFLIK